MFLEHMNHAKTVEPFVTVCASWGESYVPGEALTVTYRGTVTKCTGETEPQYICQTKLDNADEGTPMQATLVNPQQLLEVDFDPDTEIWAGRTCAISEDGCSIVGDSAGPFYVTNVGYNDDAGTAKAYGYFGRKVTEVLLD